MKHYLASATLILGLLAAAAPARAATDIVISAPIFPKYGSFMNYEDQNYPSTLAAKIDIADHGFFNFEDLFQICLADDNFRNRLYVANDGAILTQQQLASNYSTIADCAYVKFTVKPYFVPQLVDDVDLCAHALPASRGWRMITDNDINSWDDAVFSSLASAVNSAWPNGGDEWGSFYFSTVTYIKTATGLRVGVLHPGVTVEQRIIDVPGEPGARTVHQEGIIVEVGPNKNTQTVAITLRCMKTN